MSICKNKEASVSNGWWSDVKIKFKTVFVNLLGLVQRFLLLSSHVVRDTHPCEIFAYKDTYVSVESKTKQKKKQIQYILLVFTYRWVL